MIGDWLRAAETDKKLLAIRQQEELIVQVTELISVAMERQGLTKADLAARLGKSRPFVTQVLSGDANMTLKTAADLFTALGLELHVGYRKLDHPAAPIDSSRTVAKAPKTVEVQPKRKSPTPLSKRRGKSRK